MKGKQDICQLVSLKCGLLKSSCTDFPPGLCAWLQYICHVEQLGCLFYKPDPGVKGSFLVCLNSSLLESFFQNSQPVVFSPSSSLRKRNQHLAPRRPSMNINCAGGKRSLESTCSVENGTVAVRETEEGNVVLGGHSPSAGLRNEGEDIFTLHWSLREILGGGGAGSV